MSTQLQALWGVRETNDFHYEGMGHVVLKGQTDLC